MPNSLYRKLFATRLLLFVVLLASFHAHAATEDTNQRTQDKLPKVITGKVIKVQDGDTITILDGAKNQHRIRLAQIDAPETGQPFTTRSKKALVDKVFGKTVQVDWQKMDRNKRIIGEVRLADRSINAEMVAEGWLPSTLSSALCLDIQF